MDMETIKEKIERWKILAEILDKGSKKIFIRDISGDLFFGEIVLIGENQITIDCFGPPQRAGKREYIYWINVSDCDEFKGEGK